MRQIEPNVPNAMRVTSSLQHRYAILMLVLLEKEYLILVFGSAHLVIYSDVSIASANEGILCYNDYNQCISCITGKFIFVDSSSNTQCVSVCPPGYSSNMTTKICDKCQVENCRPYLIPR